MARDLPCDMPLSAVALTGDGVRVGEKVCTPKSPVPVIRLAGKNDRYTPFEGGSGCLGGEFLSTEETDALWRQRNQCKDKRSQYLKKGADICYQWSCKQPFVSCQMEGGHDWPSAKPSQLEIPGCVASPPEFPVGDTIWKFFTEKGRSLEVAE